MFIASISHVLKNTVKTKSRSQGSTDVLIAHARRMLNFYWGRVLVAKTKLIERQGNYASCQSIA
jgi:hypothetical protein